jgi:hypothetical protein
MSCEWADVLCRWCGAAAAEPPDFVLCAAHARHRARLAALDRAERVAEAAEIHGPLFAELYADEATA